jgi:spermidine/putrescine transport system substrate-binding protein
MKHIKSIALSLMTLVATQSIAAKQVVVYNWSEYIPEAVVAKFTEETGIKVIYSTYESNEVMYAKLQLQKNTGYDVIVPSAYYVAKMAKEKMLLSLDKSKLTHFKQLNATLLNKEFDPGNQYSAPYLWGSTGIGLNSNDIDPASITSWKQLFDKKYAKQLLLTDDMREVFHIALVLNGHSPNTTKPEEIKQAYELLKTLMPNVLTFNSDAPREPFLAGDVSLGMIWSGEAVMAQEEDPAIQYIYPSEGAIFWVDSFAIPAGAKNVEEALAFIDFMLRADNAAACVEEIGYATANKEALKLIEENTRNNPAIFPSEETIKAGFFQNDVGDALNIYNQYWELLKVGN